MATISASEQDLIYLLDAASRACPTDCEVGALYSDFEMAWIVRHRNVELGFDVMFLMDGWVDSEQTPYLARALANTHKVVTVSDGG